MDDLVQFLRARLDEDEQMARAATPGPWRDDGGYVTDVGPGGLPKVQVTDYGTQDDEDGGPQGCADAAHIARHDPARVLAEVDAKRQQLSEADSFCAEYEADTDDDNSAEQRADCWRDTIRRLLALPYADHPDYDEEWRP